MKVEPRTITEASALILRGDLTPFELLQQCLSRLARYEPKVRAWAYLDRDRAQAEARERTEELARGYNRGPLHGIPVGIKDIIDVYDMPTGCGSKLWANSYARADATCVKRLRQAGAIILGKTVTTAYAYLDPPVTRNPWDLSRTPGGSSSGSAAAVACGMCLAALGTQTGGSTTRPASFCGVCSMKPTHGLASLQGVLPLAPSLDHLGIMANCVRDLAVVFQAVAGFDPDEPLASARAITGCLPAIDRELSQLDADRRRSEPPLRKRFLRPAELFPDSLDPAAVVFMRDVLAKLEGLAHSQALVERVNLPPAFGDVHRRHGQIMAAEASRVHLERLRRHPEDYPPEIRELVSDGASLSAVEIADAEFLRAELKGTVISPHSGEVLVSPAALGPAPSPETTGSAWCNSPWSFLGFPTVSVPLGASPDGLPLAVQFACKEHRDAEVLARAAWVERIFELDGAYEPRGWPPLP